LAIPLRLMGRHVIVIGHLNLDERKTLRQRIFHHRRYLTSLAFANAVVGVSNAVADELRTLFPKKRIVAIPNWISDIPAFQPRQSEADNLRLLFVGRIARLKGLHLLIEALRGVPNATLTVVGDGADRSECERAAKGLPVTFVGFQSMPQLYYDRADLILNPSIGPEGSSMVALEAMAMSLPIIMSDITVFREVSNNGSAALLFKSGDSDDLREKILSFRDAALRRGYAERGHTWVLKEHSSTNAKREYLGVFGVSQNAAGHASQPVDSLVPHQPLRP
jgi:glycosyltransferase involved in cell wall biosynthesis